MSSTFLPIIPMKAIQHGAVRLEVRTAYPDGSGIEVKVTALGIQYAANWLADARVHVVTNVSRVRPAIRASAARQARAAFEARLDDLLRLAGQDPDEWRRLNTELYAK